MAVIAPAPIIINDEEMVPSPTKDCPFQVKNTNGYYQCVQTQQEADTISYQRNHDTLVAVGWFFIGLIAFSVVIYKLIIRD